MPAPADLECCRIRRRRFDSARAIGRLTSAGVALLLGLALASQPVGAQEWHELYADGQAQLRNGRPQQAVQLLRRAIQKRAQPGVSVPTYGTNFEPQYYPYLRLAESYLQLEAYDEALKVLETSAQFGVEPASERLALETRAKAALVASRPLPTPSQTASRDSTKNATVVPAPPPPPQIVTAPKSEVDPKAGTIASATPPTTRTDLTTRSAPTLDVISDPPGAQLFVDDALVGRTDPTTGRLRVTTLRPGKHRVRLAADGREDLTREVVLLNEPLAFHGVLSPLPANPSVTAPPAASLPPAGASKSPAASDPATGSPARWWFLGVVPVAFVVALFGRRQRQLANDAKPAPAHLKAPTPAAEKAPTPRPLRTEEGSYDHFPAVFGEYELVRRIGKGGMASVYEATRRGETFALKRPLSGFLDDPRLLERFAHEAELGRALHHPNIVRITDRGQVGVIPYFAMELIDGETLRDRLDREGRLDPRMATSIAARVAEALDYAHHKGVIHRDLKPSNIMLEQSGGLKVMDYGVARARFQAGLTTAGGFIGTPHYAAPEALDGQTEPRSDLYSLGVVFFETLTGALPFPSENPYAVLNAHRDTPPPTPSTLNYAVSAELDRIVLRLLSKTPEERPTAEELLNQLTDYQETLR